MTSDIRELKSCFCRNKAQARSQRNTKLGRSRPVIICRTNDDDDDDDEIMFLHCNFCENKTTISTRF
jgi:hypothetical protein